MLKKSLAKTKNHQNHWYLASTVALVIVLAVVGVALGIRAHNHRIAQTGDQSAYNRSKKEAVVNDGGTPVTDNAKGPTPSGAYIPPANDNGITITPTIKNDQVIITTKLAGYSDGTCSLTASNGSKTTTQTADVIYAPNFSTCAGFSVPISTLGSGTWTITLNIASGGGTTSKTTLYEVSP